MIKEELARSSNYLACAPLSEVINKHYQCNTYYFQSMVTMNEPAASVRDLIFMQLFGRATLFSEVLSYSHWWAGRAIMEKCFGVPFVIHRQSNDACRAVLYRIAVLCVCINGHFITVIHHSLV